MHANISERHYQQLQIAVVKFSDLRMFHCFYVSVLYFIL